MTTNLARLVGRCFEIEARLGKLEAIVADHVGGIDADADYEHHDTLTLFEARLGKLEAIVADHVGGIDTALELAEHHDTMAPPLPEEPWAHVRCGARTATGATCDLPSAHGGQHRRVTKAAR